MALQNIGASNRDDAFYRYKMPKMITKIEGRGNGIRTNAISMGDIAKTLARPTVYTTKYFGCELGAQSKFDGGLQMVLLHALESFCGKASTEAVKEAALILKELYDCDVLVEESILQWYGIGKARLAATRVHKFGRTSNPSLNGLKMLSLNPRKNKQTITDYYFPVMFCLPYLLIKNV